MASNVQSPSAESQFMSPTPSTSTSTSTSTADASTAPGDFRNPELRRRLAGPAIRGFFGLARVWELSSNEQLDLLGSPAESTLDKWQTEQPELVTADVLMRISYLFGIHEGLQRLMRRAPLEANRWVRRPNAGHPFNGRSPIELMRVGGIPAMAEVRSVIDAVAGGPPSRAPRELPESPKLFDVSRLTAAARG